ncbi:hypothetical protein [Fimbriiglobus ruber]|uniref:DUF2306 domain-containing protein n=1 Tax=Fimbriiglobus ruber TaxID=1908690 RepID=A0A225DKV2_9BACT|nr:hypothetical protein [Fimbriiglobus ruber]OWK40284.1 hypothetical protein FRUB_05203 [Fimbriiglobus ruber]
MSAFVILHTVVSILPIGFGFYAYIRDGKIDPRNRVGMLYVVTMLAGTVSSFGFIATLGFTPGQVLTLITLALLVFGMITVRGHWRNAGYVQTICLSTSFLLLMVFASTETLKRVPPGEPFATGPADPSLIPVRLGLLVLYAIGLGYQLLKLRAANGQHRVTVQPEGPAAEMM